MKPFEIEERIKETIKAQFQLYSKEKEIEKMVNDYSKKMLNNRDQVKKAYDQLVERKIFKYIKSTITINEKDISLDEFNKSIEK